METIRKTLKAAEMWKGFFRGGGGGEQPEATQQDSAIYRGGF